MVGIISISTVFIFHERKPVVKVSINSKFVRVETTYKRLVAVLGAGMSQRTSLPYLRMRCQKMLTMKISFEHGDCWLGQWAASHIDE